MNIQRLARHLLTTRRHAKRHFPEASLAAIKAAIVQSEASHKGEIRFAIEAALEPGQVWRNMTPRQRALDLFSDLRVWDTRDNSGVLVYVLLADRAIEIIADRGIHARAGDDVWTRIAAVMREAFAAGEFEAGAIAGIDGVSRELIRHVPAAGDNPDELANEVTLL